VLTRDYRCGYVFSASAGHRLISERTKAALAIRKVSGAKLGNPINIGEAGMNDRAAQIAAADENAGSLLPALRAIRVEGAITIGAITRALNERKIATPRGTRWHVSTVANLLTHAQKLEELR